MSDLDEKKSQLVLNRSGQFEAKTVEGFNVCTSHLEILTSNLKSTSICYAESHPKENPRLKGRIYKAADVISPNLSSHVLEHTGFLLPIGGLICKKCKLEINQSLPLLPKRKKLEVQTPTKSLENLASSPLLHTSTENQILDGGDHLNSAENQLLDGDDHLKNLLSSPKSNHPEKSHSLVGSDKSFKLPWEHLQDDRKKALNLLFKANNMDMKFEFQMNQPLHKYDESQQYRQMELILASFQAVLNTVCLEKSFHKEVWAKVLESHKMDDEIGYIDANLIEVIEVYNKCVSNQQRIHVSMLIYS